MAEDMEEVEVSAPTVGSKIKKPPSAWKAALLGLPGGPLVSLGFGIAQHMRNKSYLENEAARQVRDRNERDQITSVLDKEIGLADDDEKRLLQYAKGRVADGYERIAGGDKSGYEIIDHANQIIEQVMGKDIDARKQEVKEQADTQRDLITTAAKGYRQEHQNTIDAVSGILHQSTKILDLVAQPDFDPNKPINKAHLAELLSMGGLMFKDTPDLMDGLTQGVGAFNNTAGGLVGGVATMMKSQDFKVSAEDYNRLALNAQKYAKIFGQQKMDQLGSQARNLDTLGKRLGVIPQDYSLGDYVSGGEAELRTVPVPEFKGGYREPAPTQERTATGKLVEKRKRTLYQQLTTPENESMLDPLNWFDSTRYRRPTN
jgi:hypothetical protein